MKTIRLFLLATLVLCFWSGQAQTGTKGNTAPVTKESGSETKVEAYYFHFTSRCMTCRTVEERAKENLQSLYPKLWKSGKLTFQTANLNEKEGKALAEKLGVSGQTLLLKKGSQKINITNEAFLYAVTNPEKYTKVIREKVDELLKQ